MKLKFTLSVRDVLRKFAEEDERLKHEQNVGGTASGATPYATATRDKAEPVDDIEDGGDQPKLQPTSAWLGEQ